MIYIVLIRCHAWARFNSDHDSDEYEETSRWSVHRTQTEAESSIETAKLKLAFDRDRPFMATIVEMPGEVVFSVGSEEQ